MSQQISTAFSKQFGANIRILAQQKTARFGMAVRHEHIRGEEAYFDQLGNVTAQKSTTRHADTEYTDTPHSRRHITTYTYRHADLIDSEDKVRTLIDPTSDYARVFSMAFARAKDDDCIASFFADAKTGKDGTGTALWSAAVTAGYQVAVDYTGTGTTSQDHGLTTAKMTEARRILLEAENDPEEGFFFALSQRQITDLLHEIIHDKGGIGIQFGPAVSADFTEKKGLASGDLDYYAGFKLIRTERLTLSGTDTRCPAWAKNSMCMGTAMNDESHIDQIPTKNYSWQVFHRADFGSSRMDETGVVEVLCDPTEIYPYS